MALKKYEISATVMRGIGHALALAEAGGPAELTGDTLGSAKSEKAYEEVVEALAWWQDQQKVRRRAKR